MSNAFQEQLAALGYKAGWKFAAAMPEPLAVKLFDVIADIASGKGKGPEQLRKNLARVVGPENVTRDLVRRSMRSYMRYWREAFRLPTIASPEFAAGISEGIAAEDEERARAAWAKGKGLIFTLPHSGNWDMAGMWLVQNFGPFTTVAERLKPESLFEAFVEYRESLGFEIIALTGSEIPPLKRMEEVLRSGGIVCLMGERDMSGHGVDVEFFGETTSMPAGPALLAQRTGAALMAVGISFRGGSSTPEGGPEQWHFDVSEVIDADRPLEEVVQEIAHHFESTIAAHPQDWHMLQPLWFSDLSERRRARMSKVRQEKARRDKARENTTGGLASEGERQ